MTELAAPLIPALHMTPTELRDVIILMTAPAFAVGFGMGFIIQAFTGFGADLGKWVATPLVRVIRARVGLPPLPAKAK